MDIPDQARVLNASQVQQVASDLPDTLNIITTKSFVGSTADFTSQYSIIAKFVTKILAHNLAPPFILIVTAFVILIGSSCHPERSEGSQPTVNVTPFK